MKVVKKIIYATIVLMFISNMYGMTLYADNNTSSNGLFWWTKAGQWYSGGSPSATMSSDALNGIRDTVDIIGTAIIAIATVVLGARYVFASATGKAEVKESLITLLIACFFFFGWSNISDLLIKNVGNDSAVSGNTQLFIFNNGDDLSSIFARIFTMVVTIAQAVCIIIIMYMGVEYIFAGANAKAELKEKSPAVIIGLIMVFCTVSLLKFIVKAVGEIN